MLELIFDILTKFFNKLTEMSDSVGQSLANAGATQILPWLFGFLFVAAIIYTIFEEDLVDGVRRVVHAVVVCAIVLGLLTNWTYIAGVARATSNELASMAGGSGAGSGAPLAVTAAQNMNTVANSIFEVLMPSVFRSPNAPAPTPADPGSPVIPGA